MLCAHDQTKLVLFDLSQVTLEEANARASELNIMFMETSAKAGHNVKSLFKKIAMSLVGMEKEGEASAEAQNASTSSSTVYSCVDVALERLRANVCPIEIDVTATPANDVPDASQCQC